MRFSLAKCNRCADHDYAGDGRSPTQNRPGKPGGRNWPSHNIGVHQFRNCQRDNLAAFETLRQMIQDLKSVVAPQRLFRECRQKIRIRMQLWLCRLRCAARQPPDHDFGYVCHLLTLLCFLPLLPRSPRTSPFIPVLLRFPPSSQRTKNVHFLASTDREYSHEGLGRPLAKPLGPGGGPCHADRDSLKSASAMT